MYSKRERDREGDRDREEERQRWRENNVHIPVYASYQVPSLTFRGPSLNFSLIGVKVDQYR